MTSVCEPDIVSSQVINAYFVPSCGDLEISNNINESVVNIYQMDPSNDKGLKGVLPIKLGKYDVNNDKLQTVSRFI